MYLMIYYDKVRKSEGEGLHRKFASLKTSQIAEVI